MIFRENKVIIEVKEVNKEKIYGTQLKTVSNINSLQNPRVKQAVRLRDRRDRDREQLFLIEGYRELLRAGQNNWPMEHLFFSPPMFKGRNESALLREFQNSGVPIFETSEKVMQKMSYRDRPEGLLGVARQVRRGLSDLDSSSEPLLLIGEAIEKPGNLGTMLRSADAAGVDAFILCDRRTDLFNPNVVRASTGILFTMPVFETSSDELIPWLEKRNIRVIAASPHAECLYTDIVLTGPVALAVGAEQYGLSERWMNETSSQVRIPMLGTADSLNVASAATLLLFEAVRQRRNYSLADG